jgi:hypothetical protein
MVVLREACHNALFDDSTSTAADSAPRVLVKGTCFASTLQPTTFGHR